MNQNRQKVSYWRATILLVLHLIPLGACYAQLVQFQWAKHPGYGYGYAITADEAGNSYMAGEFTDTFDAQLASGVFRAADQRYLFVSKTDVDGKCIWAKQMTTLKGYNSGLLKASTIALDNSGNIYVAGNFADTLEIDPGPNGLSLVAQNRYAGGVNGIDGFILKFSGSGDLLWAGQFRSNVNGYCRIHGITIDDAGNIYTAGTAIDTVDFDAGMGVVKRACTGGIFVAKLNSEGSWLWTHLPEKNGAGGGIAYDVALDSSGNVYTTGEFRGTIDFDDGVGSSQFKSAGDRDVFITKLDGQGRFQWTKCMGGELRDIAFSLAVDPCGNVYTTGRFSGKVDMDPGPDSTFFFSIQTSFYSSDVFVSKLNTQGDLVWAKQIGGTGGDQANGIAIDRSGYIYITGQVENAEAEDSIMNFDPNSESQISGTSLQDLEYGYNLFALKLNAYGHFVWAGTVGSPHNNGDTWGNAIAVNNSGNIYMTGTFRGEADFDPGLDSFTLYSPDPSIGNSVTNHGIFSSRLKDTTYIPDTTPDLVVETCDSFTKDGRTYYNSGIYYQAIPVLSGCDSIITLKLTINKIEPAIITTNEFVLGTTVRYHTYQWLKNGILIARATDSIYKVTENADYSVAVTASNGCLDTSAIYKVTNASGLPSINIEGEMYIYPNPSRDILTIQSPVAINVSLMGTDGRLIRQIEDAKKMTLYGLAEGIYLLRIMDKDGGFIKTVKIVKVP